MPHGHQTDYKTDKCLDNVIRGAFMTGVAVGARYPELDAIPEGELEVQFAAFKNLLAGNEPWSSREWFDRRKEAGLANPYPPQDRLCPNRDCGQTAGHRGVCD